MTAHFVNLLEELTRRVLRMASQVEDILHEACEAVYERDPELARRVIERDKEIDATEVEVEAEVIRLLALYQPVGRDLRFLCGVLKINNDLECVGDCAVNLAERARHAAVQPLARDSRELKQLVPAVRQAVRTAVQAFNDIDADAARRVIGEDSIIDALYAQIVQRIVASADRSVEGLAAHLDLLSVAKNLERIADHAGTIAKNVIFVSTGQIVRHRTHEIRDAAARR